MKRHFITRDISIEADELEERFVKSSGPGGQHVNVTSSAVQLRFDVRKSPSLPDSVKHRLEALAGSRLTTEGVLILVSEQHRSQHLNRQEVRERLFRLIEEATFVPKKRRPTKPSRGAKAQRVDQKKQRGAVKSLRGRVTD